MDALAGSIASRSCRVRPTCVPKRRRSSAARPSRRDARSDSLTPPRAWPRPSPRPRAPPWAWARARGGGLERATPPPRANAGRPVTPGCSSLPPAEAARDYVPSNIIPVPGMVPASGGRPGELGGEPDALKVHVERTRGAVHSRWGHHTVDSGHYLEAERERHVCLQVVAGPHNHERRVVSGRESR